MAPTEVNTVGQPGHHLSITSRAFLFLLVSPLTAYRSPLTAVQIQDNSFLIEEAYNQERGVVQHIGAFERASGGGWEFAFTQEWPLGGIRHQLSYTIPVQRGGATGTGLGDVALNYRYQLVGNPEAITLIAPRFTVLLPTGNEGMERGSGGLGFQANIPISFVVAPRLVTHWNAGAAVTPSARNPLGQSATTTHLNLGASAVWLLRPSFNVLVEALWLSTGVVVGNGKTARERTGYLSPGVRMAFDLPGDLQIVPGLAYTFALGRDSNEDAVFLYLSFEHPFARQ
jgi:hypothetical protein